jgi:hypothetical protein
MNNEQSMIPSKWTMTAQPKRVKKCRKRSNMKERKDFVTLDSFNSPRNRDFGLWWPHRRRSAKHLRCHRVPGEWIFFSATLVLVKGWTKPSSPCRAAGRVRCSGLVGGTARIPSRGLQFREWLSMVWTWRISRILNAVDRVYANRLVSTGGNSHRDLTANPGASRTKDRARSLSERRWKVEPCNQPQISSWLVVAAETWGNNHSFEIWNGSILQILVNLPLLTSNSNQPPKTSDTDWKWSDDRW